MIVYATTNDLTTATPPWIAQDAVPANVDSLLRWATILVARACERNPYADQPDPDAAPVLRDASCAQVASWVALGVDPAKAGTDMPGPVKSSSILDGSVQRDTTAATAAMADARDGLCALATDLLQTAGLLYVAGPAYADQPLNPVPRWGAGRPWWPFPEPFSGEIEYPVWPL